MSNCVRMIHHIHVNLAEPAEYESIKKEGNENQNFDDLIKSADFPEDYDPFDDEMLDMIP